MVSDLETLIKQAQSNVSRKKLKAGLIILQRAEQLAQSDPVMLSKIYLEMAKVYVQSSDENSAVGLVRKAIKSSPEIVGEIDHWQKELAISKKKSLARRIRKEAKAYRAEFGTWNRGRGTGRAWKKLNERQRICLAVGVALITLMGLFPPWITHLGLEGTTTGSYGFIAAPPYRAIGIDIIRLIIQWISVAIVIGAVTYALTEKPGKGSNTNSL